jgi:hypothetical protein
VPRFRLLTGEEFEKLSVREMVVYQRELAARVRDQVDDAHQRIAWFKKKSPKRD